jgi:hypothetical protein
MPTFYSRPFIKAWALVRFGIRPILVVRTQQMVPRTSQRFRGFRPCREGTKCQILTTRTVGFYPRSPGPSSNISDLMRHIAGDTESPVVSLTRSYGVAEMYARDFGRSFPTRRNPAYVYAVDINDPLPRGMSTLDPLVEVAKVCSNDLLIPFSYHHDGDMNFLLGVVNPVVHYHHLSRIAPQPNGSSGQNETDGTGQI